MTDTRLIARPWATPEDLPEHRPELGEDAWTGLLWSASELLYLLSGRQWSGGGESRVELVPRPDGRPGWSWPYDVAAVRDVPSGVAANRLGTWGGSRGWSVVALPDPPVTEIVSAGLGGSPVEVEAEPATGYLWRLDGRRWAPEDRLVVVYRHGLRPPQGGQDAAVQLAVELGKARAGDTSCKLPKRIQTITREGVTVGFQDRFEHLDAGRTGLWEIDVWLRSVNPHAMQGRARVWSPDRPRLRRTLRR